MKHPNLFKSLLLALIAAMLPQLASAYDFRVNGVCYNINEDGNSVTVTYQRDPTSTAPVSPAYSSISGALTIPETVTYSGKTYSVTEISDWAFYGCTGLTSVNTGNSVTSVGYTAFEDCTGLTSVTIGNSVTTIGTYAFNGCTSVTSVTIGNSVTSIGSNVFGGCTSLTSVTINSNSLASQNFTGTYSISRYFGKNVKNYIFGDSVTSIGNMFFQNLSNITSVTIGKSVTSIGNYAFSGCTGLTSVNWNAENCADLSSSKPPFSNMTQIMTFNFGNTVNRIPAYLCYGLSSLTSVTIPGSVASIGGYAFSGCTGLTSITIPKSMTSIESNAFYGCSNLTAVNWNAENCADFSSSSNAPFYGLTCTFNFGNTVNRIPSYLCYGRSYLTSVTIPSSVTEIGQYAFAGCSGLASVTIPSSVQTIGSYALSDCSGLTSVTIPNSVTSIGSKAFNGCSNLTTVNWNATNCTDFSSGTDVPFSGLISIKTFNFGNTVNKIPAYLCYGLSGMTSMTIGNSVTSIGGYAFRGCSGLTSIAIPNSVKSINSYAFNGCTNLATVSLGNSLTSIASYAFQNTKLKKITISAMTPPSVTTAAFSGLTLSNIQLSVPFDSHYSYYNHSVWKQFYYVHLSSGTTVGTGGFAGSGSGTESDPYLIFNPIQLYSVRNFTGHDGVVFKLMSDIDLTQFLQDNNPTQGWEPIGVQDSPFKGIFHGENHTISGMFSNRQSTDYNGLFGFVENATIENLTINATTMKGGNYAGSLCGFAQYSTLSNITTTANINGKAQSGGFVGMAYNGTINDCHHTGSVTSTGNEVGGFAGALTGTITGCSHEGNVSGQNYTGGFVGHNSAGLTTITSNANTVAGADYTGGFAGNNSGVSSSLISNYINVTGGSRTGGFVGLNLASLSNVTSTGQTVSGSIRIGGFVGSNDANLTDVSSTLNSVTGDTVLVAGFAGWTSSTLKNITSTLSTVTTANNGYYAGGFIGYAKNATTNNCKSRANVTAGRVTAGFVGYVYNGITATDCYSVGDVTATVNSTSYCPNAGGFIGYGIGSITLTKCGTISNVTAKSDSQGRTFAGGFIGYLHDDNTTKTITNCFAVGDVTATGSYVGGLVGKSWQANIDNSYYSGKLTGTNYVGGIIGSGSSNALSKNYANGSISGTQYVGGIAGNISTSSSIKSSVAAQDAINATNGTIGRIYGATDATSSVGTPGTNEANKGMTTMNVVSQGQQLTVDDGEQHGTSVGKGLLKYKSTYQGINWNFSTDWTILETESYPYKPSQCAPPVFTGTLVSGSTSVTGKCASGASVYVIYDNNTYQATVNGTTWTAIVPALQSGASIKAYAVTENLIQSYFVTATVGFEGDGTEDNPYLIYTAEDLAGINSYSYYKVMNDINLTSWINANSPTNGWIPIGKTGGGTMCQLDGDGHTISGLWTNSTGNNTGLISSLENATIKNLTINVASNKMVKGSGDYVGIVVGKSTGSTFENVTVQGNVSGANYVASIAGYADGGTFTNCNANGGQLTASAAYIGGITGYATNASFTNCSAKDITGTSHGNYLAGIDAYAVNSSFTGCAVENMSLSTNSGGHVGGIAGYTDNDQFVDCLVKGSSFTGTGSYAGGVAAGSKTNCTFDGCRVESTTVGGASYVGGLTGQVAQILSDFRIDGVTINATGNYVGGIVGKTTKAITNCYADVTLTGKDYIGGITGHTSANIEICYSQGSIETTDLTNCRAGGIVGYTTGNITNCYSTANTSGGQYAGGIAGYSFGAIAKCYSSGDLYATKFGAGIVGYLDGANASVNNCFAVNNKIDVSDQNGVAMRVIGGFKNGAATPQANNYALKSMVVSVNDVTQTIYDDLLNGIGVTQNVLETQATYVAQGWDFTDIWGIDEGNGYPYLLALVEDETPDFTPGDVNGDTKVNTIDIVTTANYVLGTNPEPFIFAAADVNVDGKVSVADIVGVANIILGIQTAPILKGTNAVIINDHLIAQNFNIGAGEERPLTIGLSNTVGYAAFQMDVELPEGITLSNATLTDRAGETHTIAVNRLDNGKWRIIAYSVTNDVIAAGEGSLLELNLKASTDSNADDVITIDNITFAKPDMTLVDMNVLEIGLGTTAISNVNADVKLQVVGNKAIVYSPVENTLSIVSVNGTVRRISVPAGRSEVYLDDTGVYILKIGDKTVKAIIK